MFDTDVKCRDEAGGSKKDDLGSFQASRNGSKRP